MALSSRFALLADVLLALRIALWPTLRQISATPSILLSPVAVSRLFFSHVWATFGAGVDENNAQLKSSLITPNAHGVVLDAGAGYGYTVRYLDATRVTKYVAVEPNVRMHDQIRRIANAAGYTEAAGTLVILSCGVEHTSAILTALGGYQPVDTIVSVLSLCSVPQPKQAVESLATDVLKPGGHFLFFEHVQNPLPHIARWQSFWSPLWALAFDGCRLDRPTHLWIQQIGGWASEESTYLEGEDEEHLFWHCVGKLVKARERNVVMSC